MLAKRSMTDAEEQRLCGLTYVTAKIVKVKFTSHTKPWIWFLVPGRGGVIGNTLTHEQNGRYHVLGGEEVTELRTAAKPTNDKCVGSGNQTNNISLHHPFEICEKIDSKCSHHQNKRKWLCSLAWLWWFLHSVCAYQIDFNEVMVNCQVGTV